MMQRETPRESPLSYARRKSPLRRARAAWRRLKLPLPHSHLFVVGAGSLYFVCSLARFIKEILEGVLTGNGSWGDIVTLAVLVLIVVPYTVLTLLRIGLGYADSFLREYGWAVKGDRFAREVTFAPHQTVRIEGLHQLAGKALLVTIKESTDFPLVPPPRSFRLSTPPSPPATVLRVRLYGVESLHGLEGAREVTLLDTSASRDALTNFETISWGEGRRLVIPVEIEFSDYALEFSFADAPDLIAQEVVCTKQLRLALGIALRRQDIARRHESSVEDAHLTVSDIIVSDIIVSDVLSDVVVSDDEAAPHQLTPSPTHPLTS